MRSASPRGANFREFCTGEVRGIPRLRTGGVPARPTSPTGRGVLRRGSPGGVRVVSKGPGAEPGHIPFPAICRSFGGALGRTRTCDLPIRSWFARMRVRPNVSEDLAYLCRLRHFIAVPFSPLFDSILVRLQYDRSTLSLCKGGVVE